jgi:cold-inducible RNA-binding protein
VADTTLHVSNLPFQASEEDLRAAFEGYGDVRAVRMMLDRETGRPKGFAFVEMGSEGQAQAALEGLNQQPFQGRTMRVGRARPRA